jgi:hypothetical protein
MALRLDDTGRTVNREGYMNAMRWNSGSGRIVGGTLAAGALLVTVGCGTREAGGVAAQSLAAGQAGVPVVVTCEPHQRTLVRPVIVNGAAMSQVECVAATDTVANQQAYAAAPVAQAPVVSHPVRVAQPVYEGLADARVVPVAAPASRTARPVQTRQVVYREPVKEGRSVKKSAIIIGSSAGVGAGVGAAVGGKKGALIGAAIGGGSAAIWDQVTRRK